MKLLWLPTNRKVVESAPTPTNSEFLLQLFTLLDHCVCGILHFVVNNFEPHNCPQGVVISVISALGLNYFYENLHPMATVAGLELDNPLLDQASH